MKKTTFMDSYRGYSGAYKGRSDIDKGNKSNCSSHDLVIMPHSALLRLTKMMVSYPMLFRVTAPVQKQKTYCGVLEFVAEEECCYLPGWVQRHP